MHGAQHNVEGQSPTNELWTFSHVHIINNYLSVDRFTAEQILLTAAELDLDLDGVPQVARWLFTVLNDRCGHNRLIFEPSHRP